MEVKVNDICITLRYSHEYQKKHHQLNPIADGEKVIVHKIIGDKAQVFPYPQGLLVELPIDYLHVVGKIEEE